MAKAAPGLHPYRRRLGYLHAKDPFKQQYAKAESTSSAISSTTSRRRRRIGLPQVPLRRRPKPVRHRSRPHRARRAGNRRRRRASPTYFSYAIDVRVISGGPQTGTASPSKSKPLMRRNLPELTALPSRREPAAIFMGVTQDGKKALLTLSSDIDSAFGEGRCLLGAQTCQLMALEPGLPETFVYGRQNRTFKIELLKVHLVASKLHSVTGSLEERSLSAVARRCRPEENDGISPDRGRSVGFRPASRSRRPAPGRGRKESPSCGPSHRGERSAPGRRCCRRVAR